MIRMGTAIDGDFDSVTNEFTIGDQTALAVYLAAQLRPMTLLELQELDLIDPLPSSQVAAINRGRQVFEQVGCATCHGCSSTSPSSASPVRMRTTEQKL